MYINRVPPIFTLTHKNCHKPQSELSPLLISSSLSRTYEQCYFTYVLIVLNSIYKRVTEFLSSFAWLISFHILQFNT